MMGYEFGVCGCRRASRGRPRRSARFEVTVAFVVARPGSTLSAADVLALIQGRLARYKHPREGIFVDFLPRDAMGHAMPWARFRSTSCAPGSTARERDIAANPAAVKLAQKVVAQYVRFCPLLQNREVGIFFHLLRLATVMHGRFSGRLVTSYDSSAKLYVMSSSLKSVV